MAKFKESELTEKLQDFKEKSTVEIQLEKSLEGTIILKDTVINYDNTNGYINIESKDGNFRINTTLVYRYEKIKEDICIDFETTLLRIRKI